MSVLAGGATQTSQYGYDKLNRLISTTDSTGTTQYAYNAVGSKVSETKPNGVTTQYRFNAKNQLTGITHQKGDTVLATYAYTLDALGNRSQLVETVYGDTPTTTTSSWQYDNLGRLISETVNGQTTTHDYDAVSNRVKQTQNGQVTSYSYDVNDRLVSETGARVASYTYDNQGNTLTQTVNGTLNKYSYNAKDELVQADDVAFGYDIDGIRNSKSKAGTTIDYVTDKNRDYAQVIVEKQNNTPVASYSYGDDLISQNVNGNTSFYGYDGLGSTKFLTDTTGKVTDSYQYNAYGEVTNKTGSTDNNYLYAGEQFDRSLNQYYLRARYYNQGIGRFTQQDTWQGKACTPITLNKYAYGNDNPVMNLDPSGNITLSELGTALNLHARQTFTSAGNYRILIKKTGCLLIETVIEETITNGVYVFLDELADNKPYVGKTKRNLDVRIREHAKKGSRKASEIISKIHVDGGKDDVQIIEQLIYDLLAGDDPSTLSNTNRPLSPTRPEKAKLRERLKAIKLCNK